jgi:hypothetical protein
MKSKEFVGWIGIMIMIFIFIVLVGLLLTCIYPPEPFLIPWIVSSIGLAFCLTTILIDNEQKGDTE